MNTICKTDSNTYVDAELCVLACILYNPDLLGNMIIGEEHFEHYGYVLEFFKKVYNKYKCLDINILFSIVKDSNLITLTDILDILTDTFIIESRFEAYQKRVLEKYNENKHAGLVKKFIINYTYELMLGEIDLKYFMEQCNKAYDSYKLNIEKQLEEFDVFADKEEGNDGDKETV